MRARITATIIPLELLEHLIAVVTAVIGNNDAHDRRDSPPM